MSLRAHMRGLLLALALIGTGAAMTLAADRPLADPALEMRARDLMKEVRCVVCQAQSIAESDAGVAEDLRRLIREEIAAGKSDDEIRDFLVARYGDFVLFKPPFNPTTWILWLGPFIALAAGGITVIHFLRRRPAALQPAPLSRDELARVEAVLGGNAAGSPRDTP